MEDKELEDSKRIYTILTGGLIAINVVILQAFIPLEKLDIPELISVLTLATALPILVGVGLWATFAEHSNEFDNPRLYIPFGIAAFITLIGIAAALFHISWIACLLFSVSSIAAFLYYVIYSD